MSESKSIREQIQDVGMEIAFSHFDPIGQPYSCSSVSRCSGICTFLLRSQRFLYPSIVTLNSVHEDVCSQMDVDSILGNAIKYSKELLHKFNDLHKKQESTLPTSSFTQTTSFYPPTPIGPALPDRIKEELYPSSFASSLFSRLNDLHRARQCYIVN